MILARSGGERVPRGHGDDTAARVETRLHYELNGDRDQEDALDTR